MLIYHIDIQVYNYSKLKEGILDITFLHSNADGEEVKWEMKGVIDVHHERVSHLLWEVLNHLLEMAPSSDSSPLCKDIILTTHRTKKTYCIDILTLVFRGTSSPV